MSTREIPEESIRSSLADAVPKVRHPDLALWRFVTDSDLPDDDGDDDADFENEVPASLQAAASLRRASFLVAANHVIDECINDLQLISFGEDGMPDKDDAEDSFIYNWFPRRHRHAYNEAFFRKVLVTAVKVCADIADPDGIPATCTAEEIIRHAIGAVAVDMLADADLGKPWMHPDEIWLEDVDFEFLYDDDMDGMEDDPGAQAAMGVEVNPVQDWFSPFNDTRIVHPYAETPRSAPSLHDLYLRLGPADPRAILTPDVIDSAALISTFAAGSEAVALARRSAVPSGDRWIADASVPESSYVDLVSSSASDDGSGWIEWEPYDGAGSIRTEPVIRLTPHRHFPVGEDEPWVETALTSGLYVAIPIGFIVSYRPDPKVQEEWEHRFDPPS